MMDTVQDLLLAIETLPEADRALAQQRVDEALTMTAPAARAALGLLALDLAGDLALADASTPSDLQARQADDDQATVLVLPDLQTRLVSATA